MISEKTAAYIAFERVLEENAKLVFSAMEDADYEAVQVENLSWLEEMEPTPDLLLAILGKTEDSTGWFSVLDTSFVGPVMRSASINGLPILIVLVSSKLSSVGAYDDRSDLFYDVLSVAQSLLDGKQTIFLEAETTEDLTKVIHNGLQKIDEMSPPEADIAEVTTRLESIAGSSVVDAPTKKDALGFDVYVEAIGAYLTHKDTRGPLALSVEGEWGSGKSSFMRQLEFWLDNKPDAKIVWFNAWRHDKEEALWAAYALQFVEQLSGKMKSTWSRWRAKRQLISYRFDWRSGWFDLLRTGISILLWLALIGIAIWVVLEKDLAGDEQKGLSLVVRLVLGVGGLAAIRGMFSAIRDGADILGNPLRFDLKKHIEDPNYAERIGFIEKFHDDFQEIVGIYSENKKVFVFIDDLDRCEVPRAADMMQALNLMIGTDERLIFIIGMDRQKIAAGLAVKFEKLLPYIKLNDRENVEQSTGDGIRFGYDFIEKFIQLPFRVPVPGPEKIDRFLKNLKQDKEGAPSKVEKDKSTRLWSKLTKWGSKKVTSKEKDGQPDDQTAKMQTVATETAEQTKEEETERLRKWDVFALKTGDDSQAVQETVKTIAAGALHYNPRRMKQFINLFRLKAYIAYNTGLFNPLTDDKGARAITFEQLAKFVTIELRWPLLLSDLEHDDQLLNRLSEYAETRENEPSKEKKISESETNTERRWRMETDLLDLLALHADPKKKEINTGYEDYTLTVLDVRTLLQVSAAVKPPDTIAPSETVEPESEESDAIAEAPASPPRVLRSQPLDSLDTEQVKKLLSAKNFFDSRWHDEGNGIQHNYEKIERDEQKLVIDNATGLTWQRSGSPEEMTFGKAETYVGQLNRETFAGYSDWRLPTLEEGMSLMEPKRNKEGLFIEPIFDQTQRWIWTADMESASVAWAVYFHSGDCGSSHFDYGSSFVRAVR